MEWYLVKHRDNFTFTIPAFAWREWGRSRNISVSVESDPGALSEYKSASLLLEVTCWVVWRYSCIPTAVTTWPGSPLFNGQSNASRSFVAEQRESPGHFVWPFRALRDRSCRMPFFFQLSVVKEVPHGWVLRRSINNTSWFLCDHHFYNKASTFSEGLMINDSPGVMMIRLGGSPTVSSAVGCEALRVNTTLNGPDPGKAHFTV
jgi:hypothetical protein